MTMTMQYLREGTTVLNKHGAQLAGRLALAIREGDYPKTAAVQHYRANVIDTCLLTPAEYFREFGRSYARQLETDLIKHELIKVQRQLEALRKQAGMA